MINIYFLQFLSSLFNLGEKMYNIGKNEVGTNCVMKIGGLRAFSQRECFLLMAHCVAGVVSTHHLLWARGDF